jgi:phosphoenolpyruvate carboxykinase (ATP)
MVSAALNGPLTEIEFVSEPAFGLHIPVSCPGVPSEVLNPRNAWTDKQAYDSQAADLANRFEANFRQFDAPEAVRAAGPGKR